MKNKYTILECASCKSIDFISKLHYDKKNEFFFSCQKCDHHLIYKNSGFILKNIVSEEAVFSMANFILSIIKNSKPEMHFIFGNHPEYKNKIEFCQKLFEKISSKALEIDCSQQEIVSRFIKGEFLDLFYNIQPPIIPNYLNDIYSGLGIYETSYSGWFSKVLDSGLNPFYGSNFFMNNDFFDKVTILKNDSYFIKWNDFWEYIRENVGISNPNDVLETERKLYIAEREFYYGYALENNLTRDFHEIKSSKPENLSHEEKLYRAFFLMHQESDEYFSDKNKEKDFLKICRGLFKNDMLWREEYFDLSNWEECYWFHVIAINKFTKRHPARNEHYIKFI